MKNNGPLLEVKGLKLYFDSVKAVDGVDLKVGAGDLTAVIGPNGAGKTTLFNLLSGMYKPDRGSIRFQGREIGGLAAHRIARRGVARSFQITNIFPALTVFENVQVAYLVRHGRSLNSVARFHGLDPGPVSDILETVGLVEKAKTKAGLLSHGDQRTLEIAVTLACQPRLLLLDEPTSGMSSWETSLVTDLIRKIAEELEVTVVFVEHDMKVAFTVAKQVVVMHQGQVFATGSPAEIRRHEGVRQIYLGEED